MANWWEETQDLQDEINAYKEYLRGLEPYEPRSTYEDWRRRYRQTIEEGNAPVHHTTNNGIVYDPEGRPVFPYIPPVERDDGVDPLTVVVVIGVAAVAAYLVWGL